MPIVQIHLHSGRDDDMKGKLVNEVTKAVCTSLDILPEKVSIILSEMAPENFAKGDILVKDLKNSVNKKTDDEDFK